MTSSGLKQSATLRSRAIIYQRGPPQELILDVRLLMLATHTTHISYLLQECSKFNKSKAVPPAFVA